MLGMLAAAVAGAAMANAYSHEAMCSLSAASASANSAFSASITGALNQRLQTQPQRHGLASARRLATISRWILRIWLRIAGGIGPFK
jgi:hypothetical protein